MRLGRERPRKGADEGVEAVALDGASMRLGRERPRKRAAARAGQSAGELQ